METIIQIAQVIVAILMVFTILLQEKGAGMGEAMGGVGGGASFQTSKRGAEKVLVRASTALIVLFLVLSLALNFL